MKEIGYAMIHQAGIDEYTVWCNSQHEAENIAADEWRYLTNGERKTHYVAAVFKYYDGSETVFVEYGERKF